MSALRDGRYAHEVQSVTEGGGVSGHQRRNIEYDSDSESEDALVEELKLLSLELTQDEKGYDLYLEQYLPLMGVHRSYAGQPDSKEYKIGYLHFLDSKEHECDPEESVLSAFADQEIPKSLGCPEYDRRVKGFEISKTLLTCNLNQVRSRGAVKPSRSMCFELLQRDMIDVHLNDESDASGCLFQPSVFCNSSSQKQLQEVTIRLSLSDSEGCHFLAVQEAPSGVECVAAHEVEGRVIFCESTYAGKAPCRVLYTGHETAGSASCCMVNNTTAKIRLQAPCGSQAMSHLSGQLLVCIAGDDKTSYSMRVSAEAIAVGPPRSVLPLLLPCTSKEPQRRVYALNREVQIEV